MKTTRKPSNKKTLTRKGFKRLQEFKYHKTQYAKHRKQGNLILANYHRIQANKLSPITYI